jgi:hypothetical protein
MRHVTLDIPTLAFVVSTRAALGVGIGLLLAEKLPADRRRVLGATLVALGASTTIPAAVSVMRSVRQSSRSRRAIQQDDRLIAATRFPRKGDDL